MCVKIGFCETEIFIKISDERNWEKNHRKLKSDVIFQNITRRISSSFDFSRDRRCLGQSFERGGMNNSFDHDVTQF